MRKDNNEPRKSWPNKAVNHNWKALHRRMRRERKRNESFIREKWPEYVNSLQGWMTRRPDQFYGLFLHRNGLEDNYFTREILEKINNEKGE